MPLPSTYFTSDFKNLKSFEKKTIGFLNLLYGFGTILDDFKIFKKKVRKFQKKFFFYDHWGTLRLRGEHFFVQKLLKRYQI